jgi:hypothetical protein
MGALLLAVSLALVDPHVARVDELNDLCEDTWCTGAFEYHFSALRCPSAKSCVLGFEATDSQQKTFTAEVVVSGFTALETSGAFVYEGSFEESVSKALAAWERHPVNTPAAKPTLAARVDELNDLCAETWCSGAFQYHFSALRCPNTKACVLSFSANDDQQRTFNTEVTLRGFTTLQSGDPFVYQGSLEEAVSQSLEAWETHQSKPASTPKAVAAKPAPVVKPVAVSRPVQVAKPLSAPVEKPVVRSVALAPVLPSVKPQPKSVATPTAVRSSSKNLQD